MCVPQSIDGKKHHVIKAAHPSPLSAKSFFGCKVFSQTNAYLKSKGVAASDMTSTSMVPAQRPQIVRRL